jgi:hypothetical protein
MDSASSDSDSEEEVKLQRLVSNENNQKQNQMKHIKFEEKIRERKKEPKYTRVEKEERGRDGDKDDGEMNEKQ